MRIVVVGGGPGGLGAAVPLAAAGHDVTVLDRDPAPPPTDEEAWTSWERRSVPQLRQPHFFLARFWRELSETAPGLRKALEACEPSVMRFMDRISPAACDREPAPGDEELLAMGFRRTTFERAVRDWIACETTIDFRADTVVKGLVADTTSDVPRVRGVLLEDGSTLECDLVVAATGRHGAATGWLSEIGAGPVDEDEADGGLAYFSRYYRVTDGASMPAQYGPLNVECGSIVVFTFPADHDTFTLAATPLSDDAPLRRLKDNDAFTRAMNLIPRTAAWIADGRAEPISDVGVLARIEDRRRRIVVNGRPAAVGIVLTADAAFCTNPVLGRGTSMAWMAGRRLTEAIDEHGDVENAALAFDEVSERELRPWYEDSLATDRARFARMEALKRGDTPPALDTTDPAAMIGAAVQHAMAHDGVVFRAGVRRFNLLDPLDAIASNQDVVSRAIACWERRDELAVPVPEVSRDELLAALQG